MHAIAVSRRKGYRREVAAFLVSEFSEFIENYDRELKLRSSPYFRPCVDHSKKLSIVRGRVSKPTAPLYIPGNLAF